MTRWDASSNNRMTRALRWLPSHGSKRTCLASLFQTTHQGAIFSYFQPGCVHRLPRRVFVIIIIIIIIIIIMT